MRKDCPYCAMKIPSKAVICPFCRNRQPKRNNIRLGGTVLVVAIVVIVVAVVAGAGKHSIEPTKERSLSPDQLIFASTVQWDTALQMGPRYFDEYYNKMEHLGKTVMLKGTVFEVYDRGEKLYLAFAGGPCPTKGGSLIRCAPTGEAEGTFKAAQPGDTLTILGNVKEYGRVPMDHNTSVSGCGYFVILNECSVLNGPSRVMSAKATPAVSPAETAPAASGPISNTTEATTE